MDCHFLLRDKIILEESGEKKNWTVQFNKCLGKILTDYFRQITKNKSLGWKLSAYWLVSYQRPSVSLLLTLKTLSLQRPWCWPAFCQSCKSRVIHLWSGSWRDQVSHVFLIRQCPDTALLRRHVDAVKMFRRWPYYISPCDLRQNIIITGKMNIRKYISWNGSLKKQTPEQGLKCR